MGNGREETTTGRFALAAEEAPSAAPFGPNFTGLPLRFELILVHSLLMIVFCYQLLFSQELVLPSWARDVVILGLLGTIVGVIVLPTRLWALWWFIAALVLTDTAITTGTIALSGHASTNLYVSYFLIMLIAAFAPTMGQRIALSVTLCAAYGVVLYWNVSGPEGPREGHLLQIPILLIMGIFYSVAYESARTLSREKEALILEMMERMRVENMLRQSEERYRRLVELSPDAIFLTHNDKIVFTNSTGYQFLGATSMEQIIGRSLFEFFHLEHHSIIKESIQRSRDLKRPTPFVEGKMIRLDGTLIDAEAAASTFPDEGSSTIQFVLRNVTERKQAEEHLRQTQKMEAVGQLAGGVAHDFNNMLTVIVGFSELVGEDTSLTEAQRGSIKQVRNAAERATSLTTQLLALGRRQMLQPKLLNVTTLVTNMESVLLPLLGANIELVTTLNPTVGLVTADPGQLEQAILNVVLNAHEAMPQGGRLTITSDNVELKEAQAHEHLTEGLSGPHVILTVRDTGVGMDTETQARIFEPFFTTKPKGKGTGLGLPTAYGIIQQSGGFIRVESEPARGTSVTIYLPRVEGRAYNEDPDDEAPATSGGSETILVAEDEPAVRNLVCHTLEMRGYSVLEAQDGMEAAAIGNQHPDPIHLLLTDVVMPHMSGPEVTERLAQRRPELKVLYMSAYTDDEILRHGVVASNVNFIQKPFTADALASKVRRILDADRVSSCGAV